MRPVALEGGNSWMITGELPLAPELRWLCGALSQRCLGPSSKTLESECPRRVRSRLGHEIAGHCPEVYISIHNLPVCMA